MSEHSEGGENPSFILINIASIITWLVIMFNGNIHSVEESIYFHLFTDQYRHLQIGNSISNFF